MRARRLLVVGAPGNVGQGIVVEALAAGRQVIAADRDSAALTRLAARHQGQDLASVVGDIGTEAGAVALWDEATRPLGGIDAVLVAISVIGKVQPLVEWSALDLSANLSSNVLVHFIAAKIFLPRLPADGLLLGIGGGTADFIIPKMAHISIAQAAQRMLYQGLARERREGAEARELMIVSMVNGEATRDRAKPDWVTDRDVGRHVCAILDDPGRFPGPVMRLMSREQVGQPEPTVRS